MGHSETPKPDGACPKTPSRFRQINRLCQIAQRSCEEANNNQQEHRLPHQVQSTPITLTSEKGTSPSGYGEEKDDPSWCTNKAEETTGHIVPEKGNAINQSHLRLTVAAPPIHSTSNAGLDQGLVDNTK